jgi:trehalose/maltose hydrolase-like predicted phosphorylase
LGDTDAALDFFREVSAIDLDDSQAAVEGGVHIAGLGGIWLMAVFGFAGLSLHSDYLAVDPRLPATWRSLYFGIQWRSRSLKIRIGRTTGSLEATLEAGEPMKLVVCGGAFTLSRAERLSVPMRFDNT